MFQNMTVKGRLMLLMGVITTALAFSFALNLYQFFSLQQSVNALYHLGPEEIGELHKISTKIGLKEDIHENWNSYLKAIEKAEIPVEMGTLIDNTKRQLASQDPLLNRSIDQLIEAHVRDTKSDYLNALYILKSNLIFTVILFFATLALATYCAYRIMQSITKPLNDAVNTVNQLALGDTKLLIENPAKDEFGSLFDAMQRMNLANKKVINAVATFSTGDLNVGVEPRSELDVLAKVLNEMVATAKQMSEVLVSVADGDLTVHVQPRSDQDMLGVSLSKMTTNLYRIIGDLQGEVAALTASSQEIVGSVSQVATGSAETAAAVAETTTSVEELKQTAHISDEKAKEVLLSAEETLQIVNASEKSLQTTIEDMGQINEKMRTISGGIVKLSEHSQTIREIIDTVNDLAEQSNVLAVNAAIEAAKAGEHGKSFSVVAQEIRTLAEQSKAATIQVRSILNDIQNATSEAVLATEQGSKAVEKGMNQSNETSEFMQKLIQSMMVVSEKANEISDASQQQLTGVGQVTVAMNNIRDAASQHVDHMKQIETAVVALNSVGESLKSIADQYKIQGPRKLKHGENLFKTSLRGA